MRRGLRHANGLLLLEMMVSLAIFVVSALAILSVLGGSARWVEQSAIRAEATDLARSAISMIELGLQSPESLSGADEASMRDNEDPGSDLIEPARFMLTVQTEPSAFTGLTLVTVVVELAPESVMRAQHGSMRTELSSLIPGRSFGSEFEDEGELFEAFERAGERGP